MIGTKVIDTDSTQNTGQIGTDTGDTGASKATKKADESTLEEANGETVQTVTTEPQAELNLHESNGGGQIRDLQNTLEDLTAKSKDADTELANWQAIKQAFVAHNSQCPTLNDLDAWSKEAGASPELKAAVQWLEAHPKMLYAVTGREGTCREENIGKLNINMLNDTLVLAEDKSTGLHQQVIDTQRQLDTQLRLANVQSGPANGVGVGNTGPVVAQTQSAATGTPSPAALDAANETPRPAPSSRGGLEGAEENVSNMVTWGENEISRLSAAYQAETDPGKQATIKTRIDQLTRQMQAIVAMDNQLTTMMSNLLKMYSDMAMTAIHNMH